MRTRSEGRETRQTRNEKIRSFNRLKKELLLECYKIAIKLPTSEQFNLAQQIKRASVCVRLNIAEGSSRRFSVERKRFYEIARGSVIEIHAALEICVDLNYILKEELESVGSLVNRSFSMLNKMITVNN